MRLRDDAAAPYLILLTVLDSKKTMIAGLDSGADDFIVKASDTNGSNELTRVAVGARAIGLRAALARTGRRLKSGQAIATPDPNLRVMQKRAQ